MKLYDSRRAPNPRRVRWFMAEKGVTDIEVIPIDIFKGEHRTPEYLGRAGLANVPALELDDGTTITESVAICRYLESVYPEPNLFGRDAKEIAQIEMWTRRAEMLLSTPLMMAVRHGHPALAAIETQVPEIAATNRAGAERAIKVFDRRLSETPFIAGERVTMADIVAIASIDFSRMVKFQIPEGLDNVVRWKTEMMERDAAKAGV
ncbi:MAG: glutathione S-transferase family protein [Pseudomonadota bacterium]|nr:glutathione S-transferase family protein [Pseudomonadota bacterium]